MLGRLQNLLIPVVLCVLVVLIFTWILVGLFSGSEEEQSLSNRAAVSQSPGGETGGGGSDTLAPEVENRDMDSYAAYESKDPFRQILEPAEEEDAGSTTGMTTGMTTGSNTEDGGEEPPAGGTTEGDAGGGPDEDGEDGDDNSGANDGGGPNQGGARDGDNDGLSDRRERALGTDPEDPDTDGDGIRDGRDDADNDGLPDSGGADDELFDSGGSLKYGGK